MFYQNSQSKPANKAILDGPTPYYVHRKFIETLTIESQVFHLECILQTKNYVKFWIAQIYYKARDISENVLIFLF